MTYNQFVEKLLFKYHKDMPYVFSAVGEIYNNSNQLKENYIRYSILNNKKYILGYLAISNEWVIKKYNQED